MKGSFSRNSWLGLLEFTHLYPASLPTKGTGAMSHTPIQRNTIGGIYFFCSWNASCKMTIRFALYSRNSSTLCTGSINIGECESSEDHTACNQLKEEWGGDLPCPTVLDVELMCRQRKWQNPQKERPDNLPTALKSCDRDMFSNMSTPSSAGLPSARYFCRNRDSHQCAESSEDRNEKFDDRGQVDITVHPENPLLQTTGHRQSGPHLCSQQPMQDAYVGYRVTLYQCVP